jgi:hypothetical protein
MRRSIDFPSLLAACLFAAAMQASAVRAGERGSQTESRPARVLGKSPACVEKRLGIVSVELGSKEEQDRRSAMAPTRVSYRSAFDRLAEAAQEKGGDAVILRGHEAAYLAKGGRRTWHPSYVWLKGAAIRLAPDVAGCELAVVDPGQFERDARNKQHEDVRKNAGVSF